MGGNVSILNATAHPLTISLGQVGPLYYDLVQPGETFSRNTGAVHVTIKAHINLSGKCDINDWSCALPIITTTGAFAFAGGPLGVTVAGGQAIMHGISKDRGVLTSPGWYMGHKHNLKIVGGYARDADGRLCEPSEALRIEHC